MIQLTSAAWRVIAIYSVRAYLEGTFDEERFKMSHTLHKHGKAASPKDPIPSTSSESLAVVPMESIVVAANNTPVATEPIQGPSNSLKMTSTAQNINLEKLTHSLFSGVTFAANSNPVFNINFHRTAWQQSDDNGTLFFFVMRASSEKKCCLLIGIDWQMWPDIIHWYLLGRYSNGNVGCDSTK